MTLQRFCQRKRKGCPAHAGYKKPKQVFSPEKENDLTHYILKASRIYYGLSPREVRQLAYQYAIANNLRIPPSWSDNECARADWFSAFLKRNPTLSIRSPQATSLSRATSFNRTNVNAFFDNLSTVMNKYGFECSDIFNLDETGLTTVQNPSKMLKERSRLEAWHLKNAEL